MWRSQHEEDEKREREAKRIDDLQPVGSFSPKQSLRKPPLIDRVYPIDLMAATNSPPRRTRTPPDVPVANTETSLPLPCPPRTALQHIQHVQLRFDSRLYVPTSPSFARR